MNHKLIAVLLLLFVLNATASNHRSSETTGKKLIQYGWDSPDTAYYRKHLKEMETAPFDGIILTVRAKAETDGRLGGSDALGWQVFQPKPFTPDQYQHAIDDLRASRSKKFTDNLIAVVSQPEASGLDWFDDKACAIVATNLGIMARVAKQGRCVGLMFDPEEYGFPLWSYAAMPEVVRTKHSYDEFAAKLRQRGQQFIRAIDAEFPGITILTLFGPSMPAQNVSWIGLARKAEAHYNLLGPFYDGMLEGAPPKTILVDGYEQSYAFKTDEQFKAGRREMLSKAQAFSAAPDALAKHLRCGFGLWLDHDSGKRGGWFPLEPAKNLFTPAEWEAAVYLALKNSDKYVWIYNERALWWKTRPGGKYEEATENGRASAAVKK